VHRFRTAFSRRGDQGPIRILSWLKDFGVPWPGLISAPKLRGLPVVLSWKVTSPVDIAAIAGLP
jgi:hypothetical protein